MEAGRSEAGSANLACTGPDAQHINAHNVYYVKLCVWFEALILSPAPENQTLPELTIHPSNQSVTLHLSCTSSASPAPASLLARFENHNPAARHAIRNPIA